MSVLYGGGPSSGPPIVPRIRFSWIDESWEFFKQAPLVWLVAMLVFAAVSAGLSSLWVGASGSSVTPLNWHSDANRGASEAPASIFDLAFNPFIYACLFNLALRQIDGELITFADIFRGSRFYGQMFLLNLLLTVTTIGGIFVCCVGFIVPTALLFPAFALIADGQNASTAISLSIGATRVDWLNAILFVCVFWLLMLASAIPCGLGLLVTFPMMFLVGAIAMRDLIGGTGPSTSSIGGPIDPRQWPPAPRVDM